MVAVCFFIQDLRSGSFLYMNLEMLENLTRDGYLSMLLFAILLPNAKDSVAYMARTLLEQYMKYGRNINFTKTEYLRIGDQPSNIQLE